MFSEHSPICVTLVEVLLAICGPCLAVLIPLTGSSMNECPGWLDCCQKIVEAEAAVVGLSVHGPGLLFMLDSCQLPIGYLLPAMQCCSAAVHVMSLRVGILRHCVLTLGQPSVRSAKLSHAGIPKRHSRTTSDKLVLVNMHECACVPYVNPLYTTCLHHQPAHWCLATRERLRLTKGSHSQPCA
jgi:hypothetical protein